MLVLVLWFLVLGSCTSPTSSILGTLTRIDRVEQARSRPGAGQEQHRYAHAIHGQYFACTCSEHGPDTSSYLNNEVLTPCSQNSDELAQRSIFPSPLSLSLSLSPLPPS